MVHAKIWLGLIWSMQLYLMGETANLPTSELFAESLMPIDNSESDPRERREGSGDDDWRPYDPPPPAVRGIMDRMVALPPDQLINANKGEEEGSGVVPEALFISTKEMDDPFAKEDGMEEIIKDLSQSSSPGLSTEDDNRQGNSLNVLPSEHRPKAMPEEEERGEAFIQVDQGSGDSEIDWDNGVSNITIPLLKSDNDELIATVTETISSANNGSYNTETYEELANTDETTTSNSEISSKEGLSITDKSVSSQETGTLATEIISDTEGKSSHIPSTNIDYLLASTATDNLPTTTEINEDLNQSLISGSDDDNSTVEVEGEFFTSETVTTLSYFSSSMKEGNTEYIGAGLTDSSEIQETTQAFEEIITLTFQPTDDEDEENANKTILLRNGAELFVKSFDKEEVVESSATKSLSAGIIVGVLIVAFLALVILVTIRQRRRRRLPENDKLSSATDAEKALLGNGKYKPDFSEDVKNNEKLVVNKYEKTPNFSSQKNLNTNANQKNIEKDNVLRQAMIEGEAEDSKKGNEDELEGNRQQAADDLKSGGSDPAERVVVHTRIDLDSIPQKPIIQMITRNGHTYHSVPDGETKT